MRRISYSKFTEDDLGIDVEDLLRALSDYLLGSGFQDPYMQFSEMNQHTLEELRRAIEQALMGEDILARSVWKRCASGSTPCRRSSASNSFSV